MSPLNRLSELLRGRARLDPTIAARYSEAVAGPARQLFLLLARWRDTLEFGSTDDELANAASIQRWELAAVVDRLSAVEPPPPLARLHADLRGVAQDTARASQLLSNGYRFHSSRARCDGQALMLTAEERFQETLRVLAQRGVRIEPGADDAAAPDA